MSEAPTTERPRGPDLSGLKIDERGRRDPTRRGWRAGGAALAAIPQLPRIALNSELVFVVFVRRFSIAPRRRGRCASSRRRSGRSHGWESSSSVSPSPPLRSPLTRLRTSSPGGRICSCRHRLPFRSNRRDRAPRRVPPACDTTAIQKSCAECARTGDVAVRGAIALEGPYR